MPTATQVANARSLSAMLWQFPLVCFTLTLLTDFAYRQTANLMWQNFSSWLLFFGLVMGVVAVVVRMIEWFLPGIRRSQFWLFWGGQVAVLILALVNSLVHAGDGWTAVVPNGLILSAVTVLALLLLGWFDRSRPIIHEGEVSHG